MIGGNLTALLQVYVTEENEIGEPVKAWHDVMELPGWIDLSGGDSKYTTYSAKIQESTHIFVGDYKPIPDTIKINGKDVRVRPENTRIVADALLYDVLLIDDPMNMHKQLEIYLKYTGGQ